MFDKEYAKDVEMAIESGLVCLGYWPLFANKTFAGVEVDRVFLDPQGDWILCEIKTISDWKYLDVRVRPFQVQRLQRARAWLETYRAPGPVYIYYAYMHYESCEIRVYNEAGDQVEFLDNVTIEHC